MTDTLCAKGWCELKPRYVPVCMWWFTVNWCHSSTICLMRKKNIPKGSMWSVFMELRWWWNEVAESTGRTVNILFPKPWWQVKGGQCLLFDLFHDNVGNYNQDSEDKDERPPSCSSSRAVTKSAVAEHGWQNRDMSSTEVVCVHLTEPPGTLAFAFMVGRKKEPCIMQTTENQLIPSLILTYMYVKNAIPAKLSNYYLA